MEKTDIIDFNLTSIETNSSLKNTNKAISSIAQAEDKKFQTSYDASTPPTKEADSRRNYRTYPYDYFTGIDAKVFFGDVWVDDIVTIQYSVSQSKVPIYGYASQLYDAVARGTVIVQGSLTIAFKEMGYLNMVQRIIENQQTSSKTALEGKIKQLAEKANTKTLQFIPNLQGTPDRTGATTGLAGVGFSPNGTAQIIRQQQTIEDILINKKGGNVVSSGLSAVLLNEENPNGNRDFEDFAEILEDTIWGDSNGRPLGKKLKFRRADEFDYTYSKKGEDLGGVAIGRDDYANCLNILITFGDMNDFRAEHTAIVLNDVHFTSQSSIVSPTGDPIGETYSFFARDINQTLTSSTFNIPQIKFELGADKNPSSLADVEEVQKLLNYNSTVTRIRIYATASFKESAGWATKRYEITQGPVTFTPNKYEPFTDQIIRIVEQTINDPTYSNIDVDFSQHIIEIELDTPTSEATIGYETGAVSIDYGAASVRTRE